jgi:hypothetical protein
VRWGSPVEALAGAEDGGAALVLATGYPQKATHLAKEALVEALDRDVRVYVEYPRSLPGLDTEEPRKVGWERGVVSSGEFGASLPKMRILDLHGCSFVPVQAGHPLIALGRVAGLDNAVYGLPEETHPLLFKHPELEIMVGATKLSSFVTARYSPLAPWRTVWQHIVGWLTRDSLVPEMNWVPTVRPTYGRRGQLPRIVEHAALERGLSWFLNSGLLAGPDGKADGTRGLGEGFASLINPDGSQPISRGLRTDCNGEGAGALSFGRLMAKDHPGMAASANLLDFIFNRSILAQGPRADPESPSYGLLSWTTSPPADSIYYGDDNARSMLGMLAAIANLGCRRWNRHLLRCLLANLRTTGSRGFRGWRLEEDDLQRKGWRHFHRRRNTLFAPHYEAYLWACFLWAYRETGYRPFFTRPRRAIELTMEAYPDEWRWTNGIAQERARMLLPLAWLVRVKDSQEHRRWLRFMGEEVVSLQDGCGALREELGGPRKGSYGPPKSNEDYGEHEATLLQANGDPICDMLYTTNFAFLGLHEAACATGEDLFIRAEERLAKFLCRIQTRSEVHPELDGAWYRGFDFDKWEYWGSNADAGWGVWSIESGWTQGWIVTVLGLREMKTSLWDLSAGSGLAEHLPDLIKVMLESQ